jgi:hypothetical protein
MPRASSIATLFDAQPRHRLPPFTCQ